ncbi:threonine aldolase [Saccharomycopsis crataegensis]|uniref:low-specificity L-threonine aldolase n=1 Tax=Saccharomycopsis crataegensis TaxID=43959 RepID=A0AAV5QSV1_9ASCO|nr:threonine aldolase [Saccharomycopsis crataegensis]
MASQDYKSPTHNDFRSDTFTTPSPTIIQAASTCSLGDDDYYEDPDTNELGAYVAELSGKESGLYCVSGVMSNQIGLRSLLYQPPYSILCDSRAHVYRYEGAGLSMLSNAMVYPVIPSNGLYMTLEDIKKHIVLSEEYYFATTRVISLENTISGVVVPIEEIARICAWAKTVGVKTHLDGARLWNASAATGVSIKEYCQHFDTVSLCLSKGIGAPIGSVLVADKETIKIGKRFRKQLGGNLRQAGVITSMAMVALKMNFPNALKYTHEVAKEVAELCTKNDIKLLYPTDTNFVWLDFSEQPEGTAQKFNELGKKNGIRLSGNRIGIHYQISKESVEALKRTILELYQK